LNEIDLDIRWRPRMGVFKRLWLRLRDEHVEQYQETRAEPAAPHDVE